MVNSEVRAEVSRRTRMRQDSGDSVRRKDGAWGCISGLWMTIVSVDRLAMGALNSDENRGHLRPGPRRRETGHRAPRSVKAALRVPRPAAVTHHWDDIGVVTEAIHQGVSADLQ
jgi:hypothetical protein